MSISNRNDKPYASRSRLITGVFGKKIVLMVQYIIFVIKNLSGFFLSILHHLPI